LAQGGAPDWILFIWTLDKAKLVSSSKSTSGRLVLHKLSCNQHDQTTQICVTGENLFRVFRFQDGFLKLIHQTKFDQDLKTHCWVSETRVAVGTNDAKVLVFENGEMISEIEYLAPLNEKDSTVGLRHPGVSALAAFGSGIMVGFDNGTLVYLENSGDGQLYRQKKEFLIDSGPINVIHWNIKEDRALLSFGNSQLYLLQIENNAQGEVVKYEKLAYGFHEGSIMGMDTCISKTWLVTSGADGTIRVWNYVEHTAEVSCAFAEVANSVTLHPSGMYIIACFSSSIKLLAVMLDELRPCWEYEIRGVKTCNFANGGHYFAVISSISVIVFDTWSQEPIASLKVASARIKSIEWSRDDMFLFTFCADGSYQQWSVSEWKKVSEMTMHGLLASATVNHTGHTIYVYTKECIIKEINRGRLTREWTSKDPLSTSKKILN
jgi:cilia- and flagella-associated protein 57